MPAEMFTVLTVVGVIALVAIVAWRAVVAERRRVEALKKAAQQMGLTFVENLDDAFINTLGKHHLFSLGHSHHADNLMKGRLDGIDTALFEFRYVTGSGKNRSTTYQTVVALTRPERNLPEFAVRPENIFHKIGGVFGYQDIDFPLHPEFSRRFLLRGTNESAVRTRFTPAVIGFFERHPGVCAEGNAAVLLYYRHGRRAAPEALRDLIREGQELSRALA